MPLSTIPAKKFPLRFDTYSKLDDQLRDAARKFAEFGYDDLRDEMEAVAARLYQAWNAIMEAERAGR